MANPTTDEVRLHVAAPAERIYDMVADLPRMGEWSPECQRCEWADGAAGPAAGARFRGHNRIGPYRWSVDGRVVAAERGREFSFVTLPGDREGTRWSYRFEPSGEGTDVVESYEVRWEPAYLRLLNTVVPRSRQLRRGMQRTLEQLKAAAEAGRPVG